MIEYCLGYRKDQVIDPGHWSKFPCRVPEPDDFDIGNLKFRINGVVYKEWNEEFEQAIIWEKLQND